MECKHITFFPLTDFLNIHNDIITHTDKQNLLTPLDLFCILFILQIKKNTQIFRQLWY